MSNFKVKDLEKGARAGVLTTSHGLVETPIFMPVGTQGTVKALRPDDLKNCGAEIILGNTYHLYLRPGNKLIKKIGGLHKFMGWDYPILTDSGGFQAFSLGAMIEHGVRKVQSNSAGPAAPVSRRPSSSLSFVRARRREPSFASPALAGGSLITKMTEEGVGFVSHLDGSKHLLTPELSAEIQLDLGSDICLVLDELLSPLHDPEYVKTSLERTHRWELRSKEYFNKYLSKSTNPHSQLFGILQGVYDQKVRQEEAKWVSNQDFDGISIGGSFGTSNTDWAAAKAIDQTMDWVVPLLPDDLPRHALGIGEVRDIFECVARGIDMFDCVAPTRRARNGSLYINPQNGGNIKNKFTLAISRSQFKDDPQPINPGCNCYTCQNFSRAYLRHLYLSSEILYYNLASIHNVYFMIQLTKQIRESIFNHQFSSLKKDWLI